MRASSKSAASFRGMAGLLIAAVWASGHALFLPRPGTRAEAPGREAPPEVESWFGQIPPGPMPVEFGPDILTAGKPPHGQLAFSPDGTGVFWSAFQEGPGQTIFHSAFDGKAFGRPEIAPFAAASGNGGPAFSADGKRLFFSAELGPGSDPAARPSVIRYVDRTASGWTQPVTIKATAGTRMTKGQVSVARNGNLYFSGRFPEERWPTVFLCRFKDGQYLSPVKLAGPLAAATLAIDPWIDPDERFLLVSCPGREGRPMPSDIGISYPQGDGRWGPPLRIGGGVNTPAYERFPSLSRDGRYLFFIRSPGKEFVSDRARFYWTDAKFLEPSAIASVNGL